MVRAAISVGSSARATLMSDVRPDGGPQTKELISRRTGRNVMMSGWIKIGAEFITALAHQWKGSSHPNLPSETTNSWQPKTWRLALIVLRSGPKAR